MKRDLSSVVRLILPIVFTCAVLAIAFKTSGPPSSTPAWAALHDSSASQYGNVVVVAKSGGDFASVQKALNSITNNSPTNRYLVWVAPGTYTETVAMKPYVDIEGAGENVTRIVYPGSGYIPTLTGASNAELRYLTVESTGFVFTTAILNTSASPSLLHVTAISSVQGQNGGVPSSSGSSPEIYTNYGIHNTSGSSPIMTDVTVSTTVALNGLGYGVYNDGSSPMMKDVTISVSGGNVANSGVYNNNSSLTMKDVTISSYGGTANYGVFNNGSGIVTIDDSTIVASGSTINSQSSMHVGASKLQGGPVFGSVTCAGVYDENYTFYPNTCP